MAIMGGVVTAIVIAALNWGGDNIRPTTQHEMNQTREELRTEIAQVEEFSKGTRRLVLSDRWFRLKARISQVRSRLAPGMSRPGPDARAALEELLIQLEAQLHEVEAQQEALK